MITIKERATITKQQHSITIDVGENVPEENMRWKLF